MSDKKLQNDITTERLREVIDKSRQTREKIAEGVDMDTSTVTKYYNGDRKLTVEAIKKFAVYFNVSADYLLGLATDFTTDDKLKFVCNYTGLSAEAIEKIRGYCIPENSSWYHILVNDNNIDEDEKLNRIKLIKENTEIEKKQINNFILSSIFDNIVSCCNTIQTVNIVFLSNLAIFFGDYDFFCKLQSIEKDNILSKMYDFVSDNAYNIEDIHISIYRLQKTFFKYFEELSKLQNIESDAMQFTFTQVINLNASAVKFANENQSLNLIQKQIENELPNQFAYNWNKTSFEKLKAIYEDLKKGGINGNDN